MSKNWKKKGNFYINQFPNTPIWDRLKFKEAEDENWNEAIKGFKDTDCIEIIVGKGEIANSEQIHFFPQCFPNAFLLNVYNPEFWNLW